MRTILVTGGAGFIGSHLIRHLLAAHPDYRIVNLDKLTYAGNLENLSDVANNPRYVFVRGDICDSQSISSVFSEYSVDDVIHLAAESHVDRSIREPGAFAMTNVVGTLNLLQVALSFWKKDLPNHRFYHVSTDEVYGSLSATDAPFTETTPYGPRSPYSASKAASDHFVRAFHETYSLPVVISNCSNNYGPNQFPEKLLPLLINNIRQHRQIPVYGKGDNVRDWLYVVDHAKAIDMIFHKALPGSTYNIGGFNEWRNIDVIRKVISIADSMLGNPEGYSLPLITYVTDRAGHDLRYAIDSTKLTSELGWKPETDFESGIRATVKWYLENDAWLRNVTSGAYQNYYKEYYG